MSYIVEVDYFNTYLLKNIVSQNAVTSSKVASFPGAAYPGSLDVDVSSAGSATNDYNALNWYVEESRIRGGFNNVSTDQGVRAYLDEQFPKQQKRINTLIYSGIYNARTGVNQTNVFSVGDAITKSLDPVYGSIQKTYAEDTNLIVFQEDRIHRALIDKDTIYTTESGTQTQAGAAVIGQFVPYKGEYGISKNPESFAIYNYRKYFSDKSRNAIMRLSNDGLTEISMYGMRDYFRDELAEINNNFVNQTFTATFVSGGGTTTTVVDVTESSSNPNITPGMTIQGQTGGYVTLVEDIGGGTTRVYYSQLFSPTLTDPVTFVYKTRGRVIGGWDIHNKNYIVSLQTTPNQTSTADNSYNTVTFDEEINGWVSFYRFKPNKMFSVLNKFYSIQNADLYEHYDNTTADNHGQFYGVKTDANVTFVFNANPSIVKNFKTISYEGSNGWEVESFVSGFTGQDPDPSGGLGYIQNNDTIVAIPSYDEGAYVDANTGYTLRAGFTRKENRYVANLVNNSSAAPGEILFGAPMTGIKGYFATVKIATDATTQPGGPKELWSTSSEFVISSY